MIGLVLSGVTAFPVSAEVRLLERALAGRPPPLPTCLCGNPYGGGFCRLFFACDMPDLRKKRPRPSMGRGF